MHYKCFNITACSDHGFTEVNDVCFLFVSTPLSWDSARADCQSKGGDLITFSSSAEINAVVNIYSSKLKLALKDVLSYGPSNIAVLFSILP